MRIERYALALSMALTGCGEGIGREIVDRQGGGKREVSCYGSPACAPVPTGEPPLRGLPPSPAIGSGCPNPAGGPSHTGSEPPPSTRCGSWRLIVPAATSLALPAFQASEFELVVSAPDPAELTLSAAVLTNSRITLEGPVSLRVVDRSSLRNVQIVARAGMGQRVEIVEADAQSLRIVNEDGELFPGDVLITRASLWDAALLARELTLENVLVSRGDIASDDLIAHALLASDLKLQVDRAALASTELSRFQLQRCGSMQVTSSLLSFGVMVNCEQPLRIDRTDVDDTAIIGRVEGRLTSWQGVSFGAGGATDLELWNSSVHSNVLCDGVQRFAVQGAVECNACPAPNVVPASCRIAALVRGSETGDLRDAGTEETWANPECPALDTVPPCNPEPRDEYPF
jgi:hypothetical protein